MSFSVLVLRIPPSLIPAAVSDVKRGAVHRPEVSVGLFIGTALSALEMMSVRMHDSGGLVGVNGEYRRGAPQT